MTGRLTFIGLALTAALAFGAVAASAASAHEFHSNSETTYLTAHATSAQIFYATKSEEGTGKSVRCNAVNVSGSITGTEVGTGTFATPNVTVTPTYSECGIYNAAGEKIIAANVTTTGCHYNFSGATDANGHATVEILGAESPCTNSPGGITWSVLGQPCIHIEAGTGPLTGVHYNNITTGSGVKDIEVETTLEGVRSVTTNHPLVGCSAVEGETHATGSYTGKVNLTGYKDAAHTEPANITVH